MIDLKNLISKYPDCIVDAKKLKAYLTDLYPSRDDKRIASYLITVAESGFPAEITGKREIRFSQFRKYVDSIVQTTGLDAAFAEKGVNAWMEALSVQISQTGMTTGSIPADHIHQYHRTIVPPNCRKKGYTKYWCDCGYEYNSDFTRTTSCNYTIFEQKEPTCQQDGYVKSRCAGCGKEQTEILPKLAHHWVSSMVTAPTCLNEGKRVRKCSGCGMTQTESIPKSPHVFGAWHEQIHPLCESSGKAVRVCKQCQTAEGKILPPTGHKWLEWELTPDRKQYTRFCSCCGKDEYMDKPSINNIKVGGVFPFGNYPQGSTGEVAPIEWIVLEKQGKKALLISRYALDCQPFNKKTENTTWETCSLRRWLNSTFLKNAFSIDEQATISTTSVYVDENHEYTTTSGNPTKDKVFLLSATQAINLFADNESLKCVPTAYAQKHGVKTRSAHKTTSGEDTCWWWLRTSGFNQIRATSVYGDGSIDYYGNSVGSENIAVRPALWIELDT